MTLTSPETSSKRGIEDDDVLEEEDDDNPASDIDDSASW
jgi:hypothetical protein